MTIVDTLKELSGLRGVSGDEGAVRDAILARIQGKCDCSVDPLGNLLVFKKGNAAAKNRVLFSAHMDEVGFIVTRIEDSGLLRFDTVGGIDSRVIVGRGVEIGPQGIYGVIGAKATHQLEAKDKETPLSPDKLYIDIGAEDRAQAEALIQPGDRAVFFSRFQRMGEKIMGRAFDNRAGCGLLLHMIEEDLPFDCYFAFTVQEETGCTGAVTAGYSLQPDISIVVETTTASDIAGVTPDKIVCTQGRGPVISFMDRGTVYDPELYRFALDTARQNDIPVQAKEGAFGGNESRSVQVAGKGSRVMAVNLPCRYLHSASTTLHRDDIGHTFRLLMKLAESCPQR